jgi:hypothetical protein
MFAYEDVFGGVPAAPAAGPAATPPGIGPSGTVISPGAPPPIKPGTPATATPVPPPPPSNLWTPPTIIGLAAVALVVLIALILALHHHAVIREAERRQAEADRVASVMNDVAPAAAPAAVAETPEPSVFGPVIERELQARENGTNVFLNLGEAQLLTPATDLRTILAGGQPGEELSRIWEGLDIPKDSRRFQYVDWLRENGADLMYAGDGKVAGFDGIFVIAHGDSSTNWDDWEGLTADQANAAVTMVDWEQRAIAASKLGQASPPAPKFAGNFQPAMMVDSREAGGPQVNLLTRDQSVNWYFKTRAGAVGILQFVSLTDKAAKIRYKLVQTSASDSPNAAHAHQDGRNSHENLNDRLDAASNINEQNEKDQALSAIVLDAAVATDADIVENALGQMSDPFKRDRTTHEAAILLQKGGLRKKAVELAKGINDPVVRDRTLSELAH